MVRGVLLRVVLPLVGVSVLLGMGGGGRAPLSDSIPRPQESFSAAIRDGKGVETRLAGLSCGGKVFFPVARGDGILMVPFSKVSRLTTDASSGGEIRVRLALAGLEDLEGTLPGELECTGETDYGNYRIPFRRIAGIEFLTP
jgi:hypothetical protein